MDVCMNERIKELAGQAGFNEYINENLWPEEQPEFNNLMEKFAELIVRECADIADEYDGVGSTIVSRIQKHFGVE
jgi:hypothetical protein